jgi:hypothetical protein
MRPTARRVQLLIRSEEARCGGPAECMVSLRYGRDLSEHADDADRRRFATVAPLAAVGPR